MEFKRKSDIVSAIRSRISSNPQSAIKAMLRIYEYQTLDEKANSTTTHLNGVGFMSRDAEILSSFSKQYLRNNFLSDRQTAVLMKVIGKYAGQLTQHAINNGLYQKQDGMWVAVRA